MEDIAKALGRGMRGPALNTAKIGSQRPKRQASPGERSNKRTVTNQMETRPGQGFATRNGLTPTGNAFKFGGAAPNVRTGAARLKGTAASRRSAPNAPISFPASTVPMKFPVLNVKSNVQKSQEITMPYRDDKGRFVSPLRGVVTEMVPIGQDFMQTEESIEAVEKAFEKLRSNHHGRRAEKNMSRFYDKVDTDPKAARRALTSASDHTKRREQLEAVRAKKKVSKAFGEKRPDNPLARGLTGKERLTRAGKNGANGLVGGATGGAALYTGLKVGGKKGIAAGAGIAGAGMYGSKKLGDKLYPNTRQGVFNRVSKASQAEKRFNRKRGLVGTGVAAASGAGAAMTASEFSGNKKVIAGAGLAGAGLSGAAMRKVHRNNPYVAKADKRPMRDPKKGELPYTENDAWQGALASGGVGALSALQSGSNISARRKNLRTARGADATNARQALSGPLRFHVDASAVKAAAKMQKRNAIGYGALAAGGAAGSVMFGRDIKRGGTKKHRFSKALPDMADVHIQGVLRPLGKVKGKRASA